MTEMLISHYTCTISTVFTTVSWLSIRVTRLVNEIG